MLCVKELLSFDKFNSFDVSKRRLRATNLKSAETLHLIFLCYFGDTIKCAESADCKMVARNRPLFASNKKHWFLLKFQINLPGIDNAKTLFSKLQSTIEIIGNDWLTQFSFHQCLKTIKIMLLITNLESRWVKHYTSRF